MKRYAPRRQRRRFHFLLTLLAVLAFHSAWLSAPVFVGKASDGVDSRLARIQVLPADGSRAWTPVLFALPSSAGFSKALIARDRGFSRNLGEPLDLSVTDSLPAVGEPRGGLRQEPPPRLAPLSVSRSREGRQESGPASRRWELWWRTGDGPPLVVFRAPEIRPGQDEVRSVDGVVSFDSYGMVAEVELDRPMDLEPAARRSVLKTLSGMRIERQQGGLRLPFRLAFVPGGRAR